MSGPGWLAIGTGALLDGGVKATVLLGIGWGLGQLLRSASAATRHGVYTATLLALPLLPGMAALRGQIYGNICRSQRQPACDTTAFVRTAEDDCQGASGSGPPARDSTTHSPMRSSARL